MGKKWDKLKYWQRGLVIGLIFGLFLYILPLGGGSGELTGFLGGQLICDIFNAKSGDACAFTFLFKGWFILPLSYALIGTLIGIIIGKYKQRKRK